ncbi:hypothetical protein LY76DRAFT_339862 [Colletotrichum caudatum]|nr:hypothetical protein LY76DRAFT_339862 [Colletotrichum caudatum]
MFGFCEIHSDAEETEKEAYSLLYSNRFLFLFFFLAFCMGSMSPFQGLISPRPVGTDGLARYHNSAGGAFNLLDRCFFPFLHIYTRSMRVGPGTTFLYTSRARVRKQTFFVFLGEAEVGHFHTWPRNSGWVVGWMGDTW